jgi:hypothetical protein
VPQLPTLYKARGVPNKQAVCAICVERTRGRTVEVRLGYGVRVWLCEGHASHEFQTQRGGRDLVLTLQRLWQAHGMLTTARSKALTAHLTACRGPAERLRPGSYAWPDLRAAAERRFAGGAGAHAVIRALPGWHGDGCPGRLPSARTVRRWHAQRRWLQQGPGPPFDTIRRR